MGWISHTTPRNTLHVINSEDGTHFEAADADEAQEVIDAAEKFKADKQAAEDAAKNVPDQLTPAESGTLRTN